MAPTSLFYVVKKEPRRWVAENKCGGKVVTLAPWRHARFPIGLHRVVGRAAWGADDPVWANEVVYYNIEFAPLSTILNRVVLHHTDNDDEIKAVEQKQVSRGYAALGYHFFVDRTGTIYEGRPLEIMGSNAGKGLVAGPLSDPDWGAIGIVLQGDYHRADDYFFHSEVPSVQLSTTEMLVRALYRMFPINRILLHREVVRVGDPTECPGDHLAPKLQAMRRRILGGK